MMFYKIHTNQAPSYLTSLLPPLSLQDQDTLLENFLTVSHCIKNLNSQQFLTSSSRRVACGMPYLLMFNKQAQSMLLRSFSNPILKYKPSTILLCFLFCSSFLDFFFISFLFLSLPFLLVMPHTSHLQERSPTSIGLLFLQCC